MSKPVVLLQCPQCKSPHIFYDLGGMTGRVYHCHDCDYIGPVVIELELTEEEIKAMEEESAAKSKEIIQPEKKVRNRRLLQR
jgi:uncharacterized Zn finger protein (UPF0148 family)